MIPKEGCSLGNRQSEACLDWTSDFVVKLSCLVDEVRCLLGVWISMIVRALKDVRIVRDLAITCGLTVV